MQKNINKYGFLFFTLVLIVIFFGCTTPEEQSVKVVENYLTYMVNQDAVKISNITCKEWEEQAIMEMDSFQAVDPKLEGMKCKLENSEENEYFVSCDGKILTTYNDEQREFPLNRNNFRVISEGGEYYVCGYEE